MWYEILPAAGVIFGAMVIGGSGIPFFANLILGKPGHRRLFHTYEYEYYLRDQAISGSAYKHQGLEAIPDETTQPKTGKK